VSSQSVTFLVCRLSQQGQTNSTLDSDASPNLVCQIRNSNKSGFLLGLPPPS
jgi:hypothetical protein